MHLVFCRFRQSTLGQLQWVALLLTAQIHLAASARLNFIVTRVPGVEIVAPQQLPICRQTEGACTVAACFPVQLVAAGRQVTKGKGMLLRLTKLQAGVMSDAAAALTLLSWAYYGQGQAPRRPDTRHFTRKLATCKDLS
jgi:hypothetical protein